MIGMMKPMNDTTTLIPFRIDVAQEALDDLQARLARTRFAEELSGVGDELGVPVGYVRRLVEHWRDAHDWRAWESRLNDLPQFTTEIDGQRIHLLHVRSPEPDATPLLLTHSWPGSILDHLDVIGPLTDPRSHGGDPADAFHLVAPSLPGVGFSGPTMQRGWDRHRVARAWVELMARLGYDRYGAAGNDTGSIVSPEVGRAAPDRVLGVHVTQVFSFPSGDPSEFESLTEADLGALDHMQWFVDTKGAFNVLQAQQPQTLAHALADSPAGLAGWNGQLLGEDLDIDLVVAQLAWYWLTGTIASSMRIYYEDAKAEHPAEPTTVPLGLAGFAGDFQSIRSFAERDHANVTWWNTYDRGGHYAAHVAPDLYVEDLRGFFRSLR